MRDSEPKVESGKETPISEMPIWALDWPVRAPTHPMNPTLANACPLSELGWYTTTAVARPQAQKHAHAHGRTCFYDTKQEHKSLLAKMTRGIGAERD